MNKIIIAIQTPRAGKKNHCWIVPGSNVSIESDNDLSELGVLTNQQSLLHRSENAAPQPSIQSIDHQKSTSQDEIPSEDEYNNYCSDVVQNLTSSEIHGDICNDGIIFSRLVNQTATRQGYERLYLYCKDFAQGVPDKDIQDKCFLILRDIFTNQVEKIVASIDWDNVSGSLVHEGDHLNQPCSELQKLIEENWKEPIQSLSTPGSTDEVPKTDDSSTSITYNNSEQNQSIDTTSSDKKSETSHRLSFLKYAITPIAILIAILIALSVCNGQFGDFSPFKKIKDRILGSHNKPEMSSQEYDKWRALYIIPDNPPADKREEYITQAVDYTCQYIWKNNASDTTRENLLKLRDSISNNDKSIQVFWDTKASKPELIEFWRKIQLDGDSPEEFRKLVNEFIESIIPNLKFMVDYYKKDVGVDIQKKLDTIIKDIERLNYAKWDLKIDNKATYPKFYFTRMKIDNKSDLDLICNIIDCFENEDLSKAIDNCNDENKVYSHDNIQVFVKKSFYDKLQEYRGKLDKYTKLYEEYKKAISDRGVPYYKPLFD